MIPWGLSVGRSLSFWEGKDPGKKGMGEKKRKKVVGIENKGLGELRAKKGGNELLHGCFQ